MGENRLSTPTSPSLSSSKTAADAALVDEGEGGFRVSTVGSPHVTGCATSHEPGGGTAAGAGGRANACCFALDVKGALRAVPAPSASPASAKEGEEKEAVEIDAAFHVARITSDPEFEGGIGPLNVEVNLDKAAPSAPSSAAPSAAAAPSSEAAIESARGEIARRIVEAVSSVVKASESPRKAGGEDKEKGKEKGKGGVKVGGEAA